MSSITEKPDAQTSPSGEPAPLRMTFEEFLAWDGGTTITEWVDGEVVTMSPVALKHQKISQFLITILGLYVQKNDSGTVLSAPFVMRFMNKRRGREPDLMFISRERAELIKKNYLDGAADLAVEIVSPESIERDRTIKFAEYEAARVREYWLIDPDGEQAEFYALAADKRYRLQDAPKGVYRSRVIEGFSLRVAWLWEERLPTFEALRELKIL